MKKLSILFALILWSGAVFCQTPMAPVGKIELGNGTQAIKLASMAKDPSSFSKTITAADFKRHMEVLCSDSLGGRETGKIGQIRAGNYIAAHFDQLDLEKKGENNSYFQYFTLENSRFEEPNLRINGEDFAHTKVWFAIPVQTAPTKFSAKKILLVNAENIQKAKVKGKVLLLMQDKDTEVSLGIAQQKGAAAVFVFDPNFKETYNKRRREINGYGWQPVRGNLSKNIRKMPVLTIHESVATALTGAESQKLSEILGIKKPTSIKKAIKLELKKTERTLSGNNVLGYLQGSDSVLREELIIITGHYDHLGVEHDEIHYGADDNASGTTGVMEIAEAFVEASKVGKGPRRSMVFMLVSGEEKGLLGSEYYTNFPIFPLSKTIANLNTDMIGRIDPEHEGNPNYIYLIGSDRLSKELHQISEAVAAKYMPDMELDYRYNAENEPNRYYERSDHYNFVKNGVPAIFYFNGVHPDYHKPTDTLEKIDFEAAAKRTQLTFLTAWELANRDTAPKVDKKK